MTTLMTHSVRSDKDFTHTMDTLIMKIENASFKVLHVHDVQATLASKGIPHGPYRIVEFCRAPAAKKVLDADPVIGLLLPCRIVVFETNGATEVVAMSPRIVRAFFPDAELDNLPEQIDEEIRKIVFTLNEKQ